MQGQGEKRLILVVEDNQDVADLMTEVLNAEPDYQARSVSDGAQVLEMVKAVTPSLILLDVMLPGLDGLEIFDMLKQDPATAHIPVVFVTAARDYGEFQKRHIVHYIAKPFDINDFLARVAEALEPTEPAQ